jgi:pentapeptide MXKDX repeat protein
MKKVLSMVCILVLIGLTSCSSSNDTEKTTEVPEPIIVDMQEDVMQEDAMQEDAMQEDAMQEDAMQEDAMQEDAMQENMTDIEDPSIISEDTMGTETNMEAEDDTDNTQN